MKNATENRTEGRTGNPALDAASNQNATMKLQDFQVGDILVFTCRNRQGEEKRAAEVTAVNFDGKGFVTYAGCYGSEHLPTGSGAFKPEEIGVKPFGFHCAVEKVGKVAPCRPFSPRPGDPGFDSVH